jgi:small subunit ribosomal protein S3
MGQKVHPYGFRLGFNKSWNSKWFAKKQYKEFLQEDLMVRELIKKRLGHAGISRIEIERYPRKVRVNIYTARPGIIIGRRGAEVEKLKNLLVKKTAKAIHINIVEVKNPDLDAQLLAEGVAQQLIRRVAFRRAMRKAETAALAAGAQGVRIAVAGRLGGAEMSRREWYRAGRVPLHTLRADIDYGFAIARATYGVIGVKAWIFRGEKLEPTAGETAEIEGGERS